MPRLMLPLIRSPRFVAALLLTGVNALPAQTTGRVESCQAPCLLIPERIASLGEQDGPGYVGRPNSIVQRSDGSFVVVERSDQDRFKVFDVDGRFIRTVGRAGEGPGEFKTTQFVSLLAGDSIEIYDLGLARTTVLDPDLLPARTETLAAMMMAQARFPDGSRVAVSNIPTVDRVGLPLHLISADGEIQRSFGAEPPIEDVRNFDLLSRSVTLASDSSVWAAQLTAYQLEEWAISGQKLRQLERVVDWFEGHDDYGPQGEDPPNPGVIAVRRDRSGRLWTITHVADVNWRDALQVGRSRLTGGNRLLVQDETRFWDSIIEVLDVERKRVIAAVRLDEKALGFVADGMIFTYSERGFPTIDIWRLRQSMP